MNLIQAKTIEDRVLLALLSGPRRATDLLEQGGSTKQGLYAALRKLRSEEVVVMYKGSVALNTAWLHQMGDLIGKAKDIYLPNADTSSILSLQERESISYTFATTEHLDTFWGHTQNILVERTSITEPVYSYDPHYWFYIAREQTERKLVDSIVKKGKQFLMTVGGSAALDKVIKHDFNTDNKQYHMEKLFESNNYYVVVIGTYITEVILDPRIANDVEKIYESETQLDTQVISELKKLLIRKARHKIKISRNSRKAKLLKSKLSKNFFVKKN